MGRQLFGTDGIRGVAGEYPLDPKTTYALGVALGDVVLRLGREPEVVIGMDTRESSPWIAEQVAGGLLQKGARARFAGVTTTPGIAYLTRLNSFLAGVMISASHNPYQDNGIKVFGHSGYKLPDDQEHQIEIQMFSVMENGITPKPSSLKVDPGLDQHYVNYLASTMSRRLEPLSIVLDCGNGAASQLAPELFERLGARVHAINREPNGRNINLNSGALHVEALQREVVERNATLGVAFDGDADRAILVSHLGEVIDGDAVLLIAARWLKMRGGLRGPGGRPTVVATVMSNLGLEKALEAEAIQLIRTPVGDKYVLEEMLRSGANLGGEQSGHVIFLDYATTGDGLLTALRVAEIIVETGKRLDELTSGLAIYPQRLVNVRVKSRKTLSELPSVAGAIRTAEEAFGDSGRVLVRFSGTEPLARVMVEGPDLMQVEAYAESIAQAIRRELGS